MVMEWKAEVMGCKEGEKPSEWVRITSLTLIIWLVGGFPRVYRAHISS
jgi:hypothetical protein